MPLRSKPIGIPLGTVEYKFGQICVVFSPCAWVDYWDWWITWESLQVGPTYKRIYLPAGLTEDTSRMMVDYWLRDKNYPAILEYWKGGEACQ